MERFLKIPGRRSIITKRMIEKAIGNTMSNSEAARWLGTSYNTYKKWSKYYNLFDQHLNQSGKGVPKKPSNFKIKLDEVFNGVYPDYSDRIFKKRLINEGLLPEECNTCSWNEERITDKKVCLHLDYTDGNNENKNYDNLRLICSNCYFTNVGNFKSAKVFCH